MLGKLLFYVSRQCCVKRWHNNFCLCCERSLFYLFSVMKGTEEASQAKNGGSPLVQLLPASLPDPSPSLARSILTPPSCLSHLAHIRLRKSHTRYTPQHLLLHVALFHVEQCLGHPQPDLYTPPDIPSTHILIPFSFLPLQPSHFSKSTAAGIFFSSLSFTYLFFFVIYKNCYFFLLLNN